MHVMEFQKCTLLIFNVFAFFQLGQLKKQGSESSKLLESYEAEVDASRAAEVSARSDTGSALERWSSGALSLLTDHRVRAQRTKELTLAENTSSLLKRNEAEVGASRAAEVFSRTDADSVLERWYSGALNLLADHREFTLAVTRKPRDDSLQDISRSVEEATTLYLASETPCLTAANSAVKYSRSQLKDALKEVRQWRRGLYFMSRACRKAYPKEKEAAAQCLSQQVNSERYETTIARLILNLREVQKEFGSVVDAAFMHLKSCLETSLAAFFDSISRVVENATLCRAMKGGLEGSITSERPMEIRISSNVTHVSRIRRLNIKCLNITI